MLQCVMLQKSVMWELHVYVTGPVNTSDEILVKCASWQHFAYVLLHTIAGRIKCALGSGHLNVVPNFSGLHSMCLFPLLILSCIFLP